jgi:hypothetical protein
VPRAEDGAMKGTYHEAELVVGLAEACGPRPSSFCSWWQRRPMASKGNASLASLACRHPRLIPRLLGLPGFLVSDLGGRHLLRCVSGLLPFSVLERLYPCRATQVVFRHSLRVDVPQKESPGTITGRRLRSAPSVANRCRVWREAVFRAGRALNRLHRTRLADAGVPQKGLGRTHVQAGWCQLRSGIPRYVEETL